MMRAIRSCMMGSTRFIWDSTCSGSVSASEPSEYER